MIETRQLRYFLALAEEMHFGRAAERLGIAQPPLSHQIKKLECDLGVQLFRRTSRVVELTEAGSQLLPEARMIVERVDAFSAVAQQYSQGIGGRLHVGAVSPALDTFLPPLIMEMRSAYPNVRLTIREMRTSEQLYRLDTGQLDIGFIRHFRQDLKQYEARLLRRDAYVLAVHREHPLAKRKQIRLSSLDQAPMIMAPRDLRPELHDSIIACLRHAGANVHIVQEAPSKRTELALVAAGIGHALVPKSYQECFPRADVSYVSLRGDLPEIEMLAVWDPERISPARDLLVSKLPGLNQ